MFLTRKGLTNLEINDDINSETCGYWIANLERNPNKTKRTMENIYFQCKENGKQIQNCVVLFLSIASLKV